MRNQDGTYICAHDGCDCRVADTEDAVRDKGGQLYCSKACEQGRGCGCGDCKCGPDTD